MIRKGRKEYQQIFSLLLTPRSLEVGTISKSAMSELVKLPDQAISGFLVATSAGKLASLASDCGPAETRSR